jgi:hypothetical protein
MVGLGSKTSVELSYHVGFTPDFGRMDATQRNDALGQEATFAPRSYRSTPWTAGLKLSG